MEEFTVNQMVKRARDAQIDRLVGEYLPTAKNKMVKDLYARMGFSGSDGKWELDTTQFADLKNYISEK